MSNYGYQSAKMEVLDFIIDEDEGLLLGAELRCACGEQFKALPSRSDKTNLIQVGAQYKVQCPACLCVRRSTVTFD